MTTSIKPAAFLLLVLIGAGSRLLGLPPNFAAVGAVALFAGWFFRNRLLAAAAPISAMVLSDLVIGAYDWRLMLAVYATLTLPVALGRLLSRIAPDRAPAFPVLATAAIGSLLFFTLSNFAVWAFSADAAYPKTGAGLAACFANALPFLRYTLAGDLLFSSALFAAHAALMRPVLVPRLSVP